MVASNSAATYVFGATVLSNKHCKQKFLITTLYSHMLYLILSIIFYFFTTDDC